MKTQITLNNEQRLYVIPCGSGFSCLGFDVCQERNARLAADLGVPVPDVETGTLPAYEAYQALTRLAADRYARTGKRATCDLSPLLIGKEGKRVEVVTDYGETRRFIVGRSTGFIPVHLEIPRRNSSGGMAAEYSYKSVRLVS